MLIKEKTYNYIDSFSGPGGIALGLNRAGFNSVLSFDYDKKAVETHQNNLPGQCIVADASKLTLEHISQLTDLAKGELDLFAGGPPCQGFSKQKRGAQKGDSRNSLVSEYIRLVFKLQPKIFFFENVAIFGQKRGKKYVDEMHSKLSEYIITSHFYNSADYGLAQCRQRFVAVGVRKDLDAFFYPPKPTVDKFLTVGDVLKDFPEPPLDYTVHPNLPNHQRAKVSELNIKRFSFVPQGGGWQDIPMELRLECHKKADIKSGGWPDVYGRLVWDGQCPTITGGFDSFTRGRYGHPLHDRPLTPREAAKLQGFPDEFKFYGTRGDARSQIGNAVPPPLAEAIGAEIRRTLLCADKLIEDDHPRQQVQLSLF